MPVFFKHAKIPCGSPLTDIRRAPRDCIDIGIINNMPDGALKSTERQFFNLLDCAAGTLAVRITFYALPEISRSDTGRRHINGFYSHIDDLWDHPLDGLIVTGAEPRAPSLAAESYWPKLTEVLDWAERNTHSSLWSCLAAHAAVLHLDGVPRRRLSNKRFGVFSCIPASDHPFLSSLKDSVVMPHSRWNELSEADLAECGYQILTRSQEAGVDAFIKQRTSLFVCFQGHPEYEANTLLHEYRRDIARYLRGEMDTYPLLPKDYFDGRTEDALTALRERAVSTRSEELLADFPVACTETILQNRWHAAAVGIYRNWLGFLSARKEHGSTRISGHELVRTPVGRRRTFAASAD